jgi:hypothetical protein
MNKEALYELCSPLHEAEWGKVKAFVEKEGYSAFRKLIEEFKDAVKLAEEGQFDEVASRIEIAERLFPEPADFSPTWQKVWRELRDMLHWKAYAYKSIPVSGRSGEWQILMDNPFTNQEVVCYPGLSFHEAAYLFGYFRPTMVQNEYIRMQRVETLLTENGAI